MSQCKDCGAEIEAGNVMCPGCARRAKATQTGKITCPSCGKESGSNAQYCYNCNADLYADPKPESTAKTIAAPAGARAGGTSSYSDAYAVSRAAIAAGSVVKAMAYILGGIILIAGLILANDYGGGAVVVGAVYAATVGVPIYVLGILVSAVGQILAANLDTAVNTARIAAGEPSRQAA